tara:strand:- start:5252 stop:5749 length:498 start_codon:yes stop_codon:yes gene_type:complete
VAQVDHAVDAGVQAVDGRSRRKLKSFFIKPKYHMSYAGYLVLGGLIGFGLTAYLVVAKLVEIDAILDSAPMMGALTQARINAIFADITMMFMLGFAGYIVYATVVTMLVSHRVSGPMIAIVNFIDQMINGNYAYRRPLRKNDELIAIHSRLEILADTLEERENGR